MIEQLSLFDDIQDPVTLVCKWLKELYRHYQYRNFDRFVLSEFSSYHGGTASGVFAAAGFQWFDFTPRGCLLRRELSDAGVMVKKAQVLQAFGIQDDHGDALRRAE